MNRSHLEAFLWLRWRLAVNQFRRSGPGGVILSGILTVVVVVAAAVALVVGFLVGLMALRTAPPSTVMLVWDGIIVAFIFLWYAGLMTELQRADAISLDRFLHLPVSPAGAFVINFVASSLSLALVVVLPAMTGLAAGLIASRGPHMLVLLPLVAAFILMMSALAYQFRGWLAAMMKSPRRRQTIMAVVPVLFILFVQLPNLWNNIAPGARDRREARAEARQVIAKLDRDLAAGRITREEYAQRRPAMPRDTPVNRDAIRLANMIVPPGWLAYGAESAANDRWWLALAGALGMAFIGTISLRSAYTTTLRLYRGDFTGGQRRAESTEVRVAPALVDARSRSSALIEARLPGTSERVSAVALATLRAWTRAPEMKMTLLTPVIMLLVFSRAFVSGGTGPELLRPLSTVGFASFVLIVGLVGPAGNQFGFDRGGFRAYVLGPLPRRDMLLGKNLAVLPIAVTMMLVIVGLSQWFKPMRADHLIGVCFQLISMFLVFCLGANLLSIMSPLTLKPATGMPAPHQGARSFGPLLFMVLSPLAMGLTLVPLGIEALFWYMNWFSAFPTYLFLSAVQVVVMVLVYRRLLEWQGELLQRREQTILEIVAGRSS